jgi:hypothetical protein
MPGLSLGKKVDCGRGTARKKYRFYGQIFLKTVITAWDVPQKNAVAISLFICCNNPCSKKSANEKILIIASYSNPKKILKTQQKKSTGLTKTLKKKVID